MIDLDEVEFEEELKSYDPVLAIHFGAWLATGKLKSYKALEFLHYFRCYQDIPYSSQSVYAPLAHWMVDNWYWRDYTQMLMNLNCISAWFSYSQQQEILKKIS